VASPSPAPTRLADVLGGMSFATDLAAGVPMETSLRTCVLATALLRAQGADATELADGYYGALLRHLGCTAMAHEAAAVADGDDHDLLRTFETVDRARKLDTATRAVRHLAAAAPMGRRAAAVARALTSPSLGPAIASGQCAQAATLAADLGMGAGVVTVLQQIYERVDGRGAPLGLHGEQLTRAARALHVANVVEIQLRHGGRARAEAEVRARRGAHLDPEACDAFLGNAAALWPTLEATSVWEAYLDAEPGSPRLVAATQLDDVALAFARYADLKSPSRLGHSPGVARVATAAAVAAGLAPDETATLRRAALLHDVGIVCVPNGIWEKAGPLNAAEWERVRLHAYYGERILARVPALAASALVLGAHHERCDASGYPHGTRVSGAALAAGILACADTYQALTHARPYRAALSPAAAADVLREEARTGRLSARATEHVLAGLGHARSTTSAPPRPSHGLTEREVGVLVQVARGLTNKEVATALGISPRTVQHHVEHIYAKIGVTTRAAAALFAVRSELLERDDAGGGD
jgi:HD-GYP domain-containing protein (c-di-GMP phosphodiesterase class II)